MSRTHRVAVLASRPGSGRVELEVEDVSDGLRIYWLNLSRGFEPMRWLRIGKIFLRILREFKPDIAHFQHLISLPFFLPFITRFKKIPTVIGLHDYWYICPVITLFHRDGHVCPGPGLRCAYCVGGRAAPLRYFYRAVKYLLRPFLMRNILSSSDLLLVPSDFVRKKYDAANFISRPVRRFKCGHSLPGPVPPRAAGQVLRFGYVGGFKSHKGPDVLIKAFSALKRNAELHLFGWGLPRDISRCRSLAGGDKRIFFHGEFGHETAPEVYSSFDILVMPSIWEETFGIAAQEAFFLGMPVIASEIGGLPEQVEPGVNGFLFKPGDAGSLGEVLEYCILHYEDFAPSLDYQKNLTAASVSAGQLLKIYDDLVERRPRTRPDGGGMDSGSGS